MCGERFDTFKEKLFHSRHCLYLPPAPGDKDDDDDVVDEGEGENEGEGEGDDMDEELMASSCDSQDIPMVEVEDPFANGQSSEMDNGNLRPEDGANDADGMSNEQMLQFQSQFIKTEAHYPEDNYDEMYGY